MSWILNIALSYSRPSILAVQWYCCAVPSRRILSFTRSSAREKLSTLYSDWIRGQELKRASADKYRASQSWQRGWAFSHLKYSGWRGCSDQIDFPLMKAKRPQGTMRCQSSSWAMTMIISPRLHRRSCSQFLLPMQKVWASWMLANTFSELSDNSNSCMPISTQGHWHPSPISDTTNPARPCLMRPGM